ncbi:hypothetical protein K7432_008508 [Basidiobolus ranarum]|uniref:ethanolamine kinase n=1 Tax=Basidiobolus ranarum TaxID=34480 RepID=A0ABR2WRR1_9FUNG
MNQLLTLSELEHFIDHEVPNLDYIVHHDTLIPSALKVVLTVFPEWKESELTFTQCKDGITNKLVRCKHSDGQSVLIRAYGKKSEVLIDRRQELINLTGLAKLGLCPPLYGRFKNGFIYGYIAGQVYSLDMMSDLKTSLLVAEKLATWHQVNILGDHSPQLFKTLRRWLHDVPTTYDNPEANRIFQKHFDLSVLNDELNSLEEKLTQLDAPVVFSHNDLLSANLIYEPESNSCSFIDYEYGSYSFRGFDIGNHFAEYAGFECDYSRYPDREYQLVWLAKYLESAQGKAPTSVEVDTLYREVNQFALASHIFWGLWALVQAQLSDIDFDYMSYAVLRFNEYYRKKEEFLAL